MKKSDWLRWAMTLAIALCFLVFSFGCAENDTEPSSIDEELSAQPSDVVSSNSEELISNDEVAIWEFDDITDTLTFTGSGLLSEQEMEVLDNCVYDWSALADEVKSIIIGEGITRIPSGAFYGFEGVTEIHLPATLKSIGQYAFFQCSFSYIKLPNSLEVIEEYAFSHCQQLLSCEVPASVKELSTGAFEACVSLQTLTLHEGLQILKGGCLQDCTRLYTLVIPSSVTEIEELHAPSLIILVFLGDPPKLPQSIDNSSYLLSTEHVTVYYPCGVVAWQHVASQYQQNDITWVEGVPPDGA